MASSSLMLLSTGRMSSEMVIKAARLGLPLIVSRTSPTDLAIELADAFGITLVGYVRGDRLGVYTHPHRVDPQLELTVQPDR